MAFRKTAIVKQSTHGQPDTAKAYVVRQQVQVRRERKMDGKNSDFSVVVRPFTANLSERDHG